MIIIFIFASVELQVIGIRLARNGEDPLSSASGPQTNASTSRVDGKDDSTMMAEETSQERTPAR